MKIDDLKKNEDMIHEGVKDGRKSYWLHPKEYERFKDKWEIIGDVYE